MKTVLAAFVMFILIVFYCGCKKNESVLTVNKVITNNDAIITRSDSIARLVNSFVGSYDMNGLKYNFQIYQPNSDSVTIKKDTVSITKIDDSTLMIFGYPASYFGTQSNSYFFLSTSNNLIELYFSTINTNNLSITMQTELSPAHGTITSLSGSKIP